MRRFETVLSVFLSLVLPTHATADDFGFLVGLNVPRGAVIGATYTPTDHVGCEVSFFGAPDAFFSFGTGVVVGMNSAANRPVARVGATYYWTGSRSGSFASTWSIETGLGGEFGSKRRVWRVLASRNHFFALAASDSAAAEDAFFLRFPVQVEAGIILR